MPGPTRSRLARRSPPASRRSRAVFASHAAARWCSRTGSSRRSDRSGTRRKVGVHASFTHVCYRTGAMADVREVVELAHERGAYVLLDAFQTVGSLPVDVKEL